ncbi:MAG: phosphatase PAP2 family protein [Chitinophagaceae bacterium]|nr:phosphatase PAP2 family protein [Chitinophagaceae bacterium]
MARVAILLFMHMLVLTSSGQTPTLDVELLKPINRHETNFKNKYLELNASSVTALSIAVPAGIAITGFITHDNKLKRDALYMAAGYVTSAIITTSVKHLVDRKRPFETYSYIVKRDDESGGLSFPSGHTSAAFELATSVALRYRKWYLIAPSYLFAGSVAWARMYQGVHYPSDVLAGAVVGAGSAWLSWKFQKWMEKRRAKK